MQKLTHLIMKTLSTTPYTDLKAKMLQITSLTDRHRFDAHSAEFTLGDMKLSDLLIQVEALQGPQRDFPHAFNLYPDIRGCRLVNNNSKRWSKGFFSRPSIFQLSVLPHCVYNS